MDQRVGSSTQDILETPVQGGHSLTTAERKSVDLASTIPGWGSDLAHERRPGIPRDKAPELGVEALYPPIEQQEAKVKILKSTEHAKLTPVFGTTCPPSGLSGAIRDAGYKFSEGRMARWLALMVADRIDMAEGLIADLGKGRVPDLAREMGLASEIRYNKPALMKKAAVAGLVVGACIVLWKAQRKD